MKSLFRAALSWLLLSVAYLVLFAIGGSLFAPKLPQSEQTGLPAGLMAMAAIDSLLLLWFAISSKGGGWRLAAVMAALLWGIKTFTSNIEAAYFMPNVSGTMLPNLLLMTVPLCLGFPPLVVLLAKRWRRPDFAPEPFHLGGPVTTTFWAKAALLAALVYPALFFLAGWYIAFASPELVAFYGGAKGPTLLAHLMSVLTAAPTLYPFEVMRGALWVAFAWVMLRTLGGPLWVRSVHVALWFAFIQNDVHLIPNPLMPATVRLFHFVETASSNVVWAICICLVLGRYALEFDVRPARPTAGSLDLAE